MAAAGKSPEVVQSPASNERLILVDDHDNDIGTATREECHRGLGLRHRAFVLLIANERGDVLLQRRGNSKLGGNRWDVSATSHVRYGETYETAIVRCLRHELGIVEPIAWRRTLDYLYTERLGTHSENEFCALFTGQYDGALHPNPTELSGVRWLSLADLLAEMNADPLPYTRWLQEAVTRYAGLHADLS